MVTKCLFETVISCIKKNQIPLQTHDRLHQLYVDKETNFIGNNKEFVENVEKLSFRILAQDT